MEIKFINIRPLIRKRSLLIIMRTFIFLLCTSVFGFSPVNGFSQEKITIDADKEVTIHEVFKIVKKQTKYRFLYPANIFKDSDKVQLKKGTIALSILLEHSLESSNVKFKLSKDNTIVIERKTFNGNSANQQLQGFRINGVITDQKGEPLPGANVFEKGTSNGVISDFEGEFSITVSDSDAILTVSYLGFITQEINVEGREVINIQLREDTDQLEEVVIVAYGEKKSANILNAVSKVNYENLKDQNVTSFEQALAGQVAGVRINQSSGAPGGNISVQIRGIASIGPSNQPLYVVDGIPLDNDLIGATGTTNINEQPTNPLSSINPEDIQSITVLKDAASTSIYGSRGSNGVILITTKSGKKGKLKVNYKGTFGLQTVLNKIDVLDAYEYAQLSIDGQNENYIFNNSNPGPRDISDPNGVRGGRGTIAPVLYPYAAGIQGLTNTDWQDEIFRVAEMNNHNVSVSGGSDNSNYYVSGNFLDQEGIVINSGFERYSFRSKYNVNYDNVKFGVNIAPSYSKHNIVQSEGPYWQGGVISAANLYAPVLPVYNPDGTFNFGNNNWGYGHTDIINPVATAMLLKDTKQHYRLLGNSFLSYNFLQDFTFKTSVGIDINNFKRDTYSPSTLQRRGQNGATEAFGRSRADFVSNIVFENTLSYDKQINEIHNISAIAGFSAQKNRIERNFVRVTGFPNDLVETLNAGTIPETGFSNGSEWSLLSYFTRLEYDYKGKYLVSASARADGSSRFSKNNKWGYFPSASAGWIVSKEDFFNSESIVNFLKVRASYGLNGNFDIGNYESIALLQTDNYVFGEGDGTIANGLRPDNLPNDELTWEKTASWNLGLDVSFFNRKLDIGLDVYESLSSDFLFNVPTPAYTGYSSFLENRGEIKNAGYEISANYRQVWGKFEFSANLNFSQNRNEVLELGPENSPIVTTGGASGADYITRVGDPIGSYFLYVEDGVFANQAEVDAVPHFPGARPGDVRYVDVDGDGDIDTDDRKIVGSYNPDYILGGRIQVKYNNFDLGATATSVQGNEILNLHRRYSYNITGNFNQLAGAVNRWRSESDPGDGQTLRAKSSTGRNSLISSRHVEDASFVRIQNISLGYNVPKQIIEKFRISNARLSMNVQNPFIWTNYTGYNPEVNARPNSATSAGEDYGSYPIARIFSMGIDLAF